MVFNKKIGYKVKKFYFLIVCIASYCKQSKNEWMFSGRLRKELTLENKTAISFYYYSSPISNTLLVTSY